MACPICDDLNRQFGDAVKNQRETDEAFTAATTEDDRALAMVAVAKVRREIMELRRLTQEHRDHDHGC